MEDSHGGQSWKAISRNWNNLNHRISESCLRMKVNYFMCIHIIPIRLLLLLNWNLPWKSAVEDLFTCSLGFKNEAMNIHWIVYTESEWSAINFMNHPVTSDDSIRILMCNAIAVEILSAWEGHLHKEQADQKGERSHSEQTLLSNRLKPSVRGSFSGLSKTILTKERELPGSLTCLLSNKFVNQIDWQTASDDWHFR